GGWGFDPIIADVEDQTRALETAGYIGIMLAGAFPMVYLLRKYLGGPLEALGSKVGLSAVGSAGMLATIANILAMFRLVRLMPPGAPNAAEGHGAQHRLRCVRGLPARRPPVLHRQLPADHHPAGADRQDTRRLLRRWPRLLAVGTQGAATGTAGSSRRHHRRW